MRARPEHIGKRVLQTPRTDPELIRQILSAGHIAELPFYKVESLPDQAVALERAPYDRRPRICFCSSEKEGKSSKKPFTELR